jgi:hypothetical protein
MRAFLKPVKAVGIIIRSNPVKRPCEAICTGKPNNSRIADGSEFTNAVDSFYRLLCRWKILEDAVTAIGAESAVARGLVRAKEVVAHAA